MASFTPDFPGFTRSPCVGVDQRGVKDLQDRCVCGHVYAVHGHDGVCDACSTIGTVIGEVQDEFGMLRSVPAAQRRRGGRRPV